jgi:hypothetical protein
MATLSSILPPVNLSTASGTLPVGNGGTGATTLTGVVKGSGSSALTAGTVTVAEGGTGATTLAANNVLLGNDTGALQTVAPGTAGNVLSSNGTSWISQAVASASLQEFSSSGTWTKPSGANFVLVETWGAGGGGARPTAGASNPGGAGGGGGAYNFRLFKASDLASSITVTVGTGGTGGSVNGGVGGTGGTTSFGSLLSSFGGGGGFGSGTTTQVNGGGGGGGVLSAGQVGTGHAIAAGALNGGEPRIRDEGANASIIRTQNTGGGTGGGSYTGSSVTVNTRDGAPSSFGGGGGGACQTTTFGAGGAGGTSSNGGGGGGAGGGVNTSNMGVGAGGAFTGTSGGGGAGGTALSPNGAAGAFRQGGGGGYGLSDSKFITTFTANNGSQTVVYGRGASNTPYLFVSSDGLSNYTPYIAPAYNSYGGIIYDGSKYVFATSSAIYSTTNFISFTTHTAPPNGFAGGGGSSKTLRYINGYYFACNSVDLYYSTNLTSWTRANVAGGTNKNICGVAFDGTRYYAVDQVVSGSQTYVSTDLISWTAYANGAVYVNDVAAKAGCVVITNNNSPYVRVSVNNGVTWTNTPAGITGSLVSINYFASAGRFLAISVGPDVWTNDDPASSGWSQGGDPGTGYQYYDPIFNGSRYVMAGTFNSSISSSNNNVALAAGNVAGSYQWQTSTSFNISGGSGGAGGLAGGGGGGGIGETTTGNGGAGGNGYCRVYTW